MATTKKIQASGKTVVIGYVRAIPASGHGALAGHGADCSCGTQIRTSLSGYLAELEVLDHAEWHQKRGDKVERPATAC